MKVCGTLRVKHLGQTVDFAWASRDPKSIQWAAFYGDCEHEVLEVTAGHRVTLTYNLYYTPIGNLALPVSDPTKLPLYDTVAQILREPNFMRKGGWLGFFCHHAYAHSTEAHRKLIPGVFKGVDLAVFSAFSRLGLAVSVHPILHKRGSWLYDEDIKNEWGGLSAKELLQGSVSEGNTTGDFVEGYFEAVDRRYREMVDHGDEDDSDYDDIEGDEDKQWCKEEMSIVGSEMHGPTYNPQEDNELDREGVIADWTHKKMRKIVWMNEPRHEDFACAGLAYGNQASLDFKLSAAAILVPIPTSRFRGLNAESSTGLGKSERGSKTLGPMDSPKARSAVIDLTEES
ncbi:MAG: hypothetical protein LQ349_002597 [Xanthoria aureola]|nr:MAG: hypothetical protein LQ349_002597 [Xanthoria aureola]